jgi:hypothetical protein
MNVLGMFFPNLKIFSVFRQFVYFNSLCEFTMSAQMNVTDIKVEENNSPIDHILRLRNGRMYEIGCWIESDETLEELCDTLIKDDPYRVVSISVYPKDKTLVRGTTEPIRFNMFMENFHDEEFSQRIGSLIALRIWDCWTNTTEWVDSHFIEATYLDVAESTFGKELVAKVSKNMALRAVEIMKQQALEHRQAMKKRQEADASKNADELTQQEKDEEAARKLEAMKPKVVKAKKDKPKKAPKNPFPEEIRISEGIWKKNPKWIKWEKENK